LAKNGVRLKGLAFSRDILRSMSIWFHKELTQVCRLYNGKESKCLKDNHGIKSVGETEKMAKCTNAPRHTWRRDCKCGPCKDARENHQCLIPYECFEKAKALLQALSPKWNPLSHLPEDTKSDEIPAVFGEKIQQNLNIP